LFESSKLFGSLSAYQFTSNKDRYKIVIKDTDEDSDPDNSPIWSGKIKNILFLYYILYLPLTPS